MNNDEKRRRIKQLSDQLYALQQEQTRLEHELIFNGREDELRGLWRKYANKHGLDPEQEIYFSDGAGRLIAGHFSLATDAAKSIEWLETQLSDI